MNTFPLVSVIMPAYNAEEFINESILSILNQTYSNWEFLICDDASSDMTGEIIDKYAVRETRIKVFRNHSNLKLLKTRNNMLELATGQLITFQDADDYSDQFRLEKMVREFQNNSRLGLVSSQVGYINSRGDLLRISKKPIDYENTLNLIYNNNVVGGSIMMIKREALNAVGGRFRTYFDGLSYQDYDLSLLIAQRYECYSLSDVLYFYRQHENSASKIVDIDRSIAKDVVIYLAKQRQTRGSDDLIDGHADRVDNYVESLRKPYHEDPSLVYREYAANFLYNQLYMKAIRTAWVAVKREPFMWINWGTLQYCLRKTIFNRIRT